MEIALVNPVLTTPNIGGLRFLDRVKPIENSRLAQVNIIELARFISDLGHSTTVYAADAFVGTNEVRITDRVVVRGLRTRMRPIFHPGVLPFVPELLEPGSLRNADVIQCGEFHQPATLFACHSGAHLAKPLIIWQETFRRMRIPSNAYQWIYEATAGRLIRSRTAYFVPRTTNARAFLRSLGVAATATGPWVPTGVDTNSFRPQHALYRPDDFGWTKDCRMIGILARLQRDKGVDLAIQALARLIRRGHNVGLIIRGTGPQRNYLVRLSKQLKVDQSIRFIRYLSRSELVGLYNSIDLLLCTSRYDLLPFAILEGASCGRPSVATRVGAIEDVVKDGRTGLMVEPESADGIASAVEKLLVDDELRTSLGRVARTWAQEAFDMRVIAGRLVEVYREVASV